MNPFASVPLTLDGNNNINFPSATGKVVIFATPITGNRTYTFPDQSGTLVLLSQISNPSPSATLTAGKATLKNGTVVVSNPNVTANSLIFITYNDCIITAAAGTSVSALVPASLVPGVGFTINAYYAGSSGASLNTDDQSVVSYLIVG